MKTLEKGTGNSKTLFRFPYKWTGVTLFKGPWTYTPDATRLWMGEVSLCASFLLTSRKQEHRGARKSFTSIDRSKLFGTQPSL